MPITLLLFLLFFPPSQPSRAMAITIDDLPTASVLGEEIDRAEATTSALLEGIRRAGVPAIGFVNERKLETDGRVDPRRVALLQQWLAAGLELGNHSYSHPDLHRVSIAEFEADVARGDRVTRRLTTAAGRRSRYFRHPFLHTGRSQEVRERFERFLRDRGYAVAPVTIDNYDYTFAAAYDRARQAGDAALATNVRDAYLRYMEAVVAFYEAQARAIVGRDITHTLLLHANALNADTVEALVEGLRARGYRFVTLDEALKDAAYGLPDEYVGAGGISWLHRWALTKGLGGGIFAGEPVVPEWVSRAAAAR